MKRLTTFVLFLILFFTSSQKLHAQTTYDYVVTDFKSEINLEKNTSLLVKETIKVNFPHPRHGIFRIIPIVYSTRGKTIRTGFNVVSITDGNGDPLEYERSRIGQSVELKIGDPDKTVTGIKTYVITYRILKVLQRYDTHDEIYWNVTGGEWDTDILSAEVVVTSEYAPIIKVECFSGYFAGEETLCSKEFSQDRAAFTSTTQLGTGRDFTIVVGLDKNNNLESPSLIENISSLISDNWGYLIAVAPFLFISLVWIKKGRDKKYAGDDVYYEPKIKKIIVRPLFVREFLPMVYSPIGGFSPSEIGTIVDEKIDIHDIVAEICELARLGFLKIEKIERKKILGREVDFAFTRSKKDTEGLADYQLYLLERLFDEDTVVKSLRDLESFYKKDSEELKNALKLSSEDKLVLLSSLKNNFYKHLDEFRNKLYDSLKMESVFDARPDKVKQKWIGIFIVLATFVTIILFNFANLTTNFFPLIVFGILSIPSVIFAASMPRRTAKGYSLFRQINGLAFYLSKGRWREEIAEKHLFFDEMLPLAISLGVVHKLVRQMQTLGVEPPSYFGGVSTTSLAYDIGRFESSASDTFVSSPGGKWLGNSSWSGGSGFSGGSSGGGFGGGGGGSW